MAYGLVAPEIGANGPSTASADSSVPVKTRMTIPLVSLIEIVAEDSDRVTVTSQIFSVVPFWATTATRTVVASALRGSSALEPPKGTVRPLTASIHLASAEVAVIRGVAVAAGTLRA